MKTNHDQSLVKNADKLDYSKERVKAQIEHVFETMIESLFQSRELVVEISRRPSRPGQNVKTLKPNIDRINV